MSTVAKTPLVAPTAPRTVASPAKKPLIASRLQNDQSFLFDKENYIWMIGGMVLIFTGLMLLSGGKSPNPHEFNYDEIYSFRRITLAPIVMLLGFAVEVYAIMKKPKEVSNNATV